jgi:hypothetical protein
LQACESRQNVWQHSTAIPRCEQDGQHQRPRLSPFSYICGMLTKQEIKSKRTVIISFP